MGKNPFRTKIKRPFTMMVRGKADPSDQKQITYQTIIVADSTMITREHNTLAELRSFIQGVKISAGLLGHDIPEPHIPTFQELDTSEIPPQSF